MTLDDLVGQHTMRFVPKSTPSPFHADADCMMFELDEKLYLVSEDPSDGYRSAMDMIVLLPIAPWYIDMECMPKALDILVSKSEDQDDDVAEFRDISTGAVILRIGTSDYDGYYPCCVMEWTPPELAAERLQVRRTDEKAAK